MLLTVYGVVIPHDTICKVVKELRGMNKFRARDVDSLLRKEKVYFDKLKQKRGSWSNYTRDDVYHRGADRIIQVLKNRGYIKMTDKRPYWEYVKEL